MRKLFILFFAMLTIMLTACSSSDQGGQSAKDLKGAYTLTRSSGSIAGGIYNFDFGIITWTFNPSSRKVVVVNNNDNAEAYDGPDSGTYSYTVVNSESPKICEKIVLVDDLDYGCFEVGNNYLKLTNDFADGYVFEFSKLSNE